MCCFFKNGLEEGTAKSWYENGQLAAIGEIKENKPNGIFRGYYQSGEMKVSAIFKYGIPTKYVRYNKEGKIISTENPL